MRSKIASRIKEMSASYPNLSAVALIALCSIMFLPAIKGDFFSDDVYYIQQNQVLKDLPLSQIYKLFYTRTNPYEFLPLRDLTYRVEYWLFGLNPVAYHLDNIILYALSCFAVWLFAREFMARFGRNSENHAGNIFAALSITAIFAIHPAHVESVAWISGRKELLSGLFAVLSLWIFLLSYQGEWRTRRLVLSYSLLALALLSKSTAITIPLIMLFLALALSYGRPLNARKALAGIIAVSPALLIALLFLAITVFVASGTAVATTPLAKLSAGTAGLFEGLSLSIRILGYLVHISFAPVGLRLIYDVNSGGTRDQIDLIIGIVAVVLFLWSLYGCFVKRPSGIRLGILLFITLSLPFLQIVHFNTFSLASERFLFLPLLGTAVIVEALIRNGPLRYWTAITVLFVIMVPITIMRSSQWSNYQDLYVSNLDYSTGNAELAKLAIPVLLEREMYDSALNAADRIRDKRLRHRFLLWINTYLTYMKEPQKDHPEIRSRLEAFTARGSIAHIHWLLGRAYESEGNDFDAARHYYYCIEQKVPYALEDLQRILNRHEPEIDRFHAALKEKPDDFSTRLELARLYISLYQISKAREELAILLGMATADGRRKLIYYSAGINESNAGDNRSALDMFLQAEIYGYVTSDSLNNIGISYRETGNMIKAEEYLRKSIQLDRSDYKPVLNLAQLMRLMGDKGKAIEYFEESQILMRTKGISTELVDFELSMLRSNGL